MSEMECNKIQPLRLSVLDRPEHSPSPETDGGICRIEPLQPSETKKRRKRVKRPSEVENTNLEIFPQCDQSETAESIPQLEQQEFRPDDKSAVLSSPLKTEDLKCTICGTQYQSHKVSYFKAHMLQHTCPICKKTLPFHDVVNHVKLHLVNRSAEEGKLDIPCSLCPKRFKTLSNYDAHVSQVHRCPVCEKCFRKKEVLDHMRTHFGQDGTINLDNASTVQAIVEQGHGDGDRNSEEASPAKTGERNEVRQSSPCKSGEKRKRTNNDSDEEEDFDSDDDDNPIKEKLIVKIQKALKRSRSKSVSDDEDEEEDEDDIEDLSSIKEMYDDDNDDQGAGDLHKEQGNTNKKGWTNNQDHSSYNNRTNSQHNQIKKEPKDDELELSGFNLEELDGDANDDSLYDDLNDDDFGTEPSKKNIKLARAQYHRDIAERVSSVIKNNTCTMCGISTQFPNRIRKHVRKVHYCNFCDQFFPREILPTHLRDHDEPGKKYICQFCGEHCLSAVKLHYHDCNFNKKTALYYHCKICPEKLTSRDALTMHLRTHDPSDFIADWEKNMCQLCGFVFLGRSNLKRHMQSRACTHCGLQTVSSCQHQKHMLSNHHSSAYQCTSCEVQFLSQHSYVDHVTERQCSGCSDTIEPSCEYLKHESLCKTGRERNADHLELLCLKCDSILTDTYVYDCHVRDHGKGPGKYCCKLCNTQFAQNRDYGIHVCKRTCPQCLGKFQPMCKWSKHTCFRMDPPSEKCPNCDKVFYKVLSYRKHCRLLTCSQCPELVFNSICSVNKHIESEHEGKNLITEEPETPETRETKPRIKLEKMSDQEDIEDEEELPSPNKESPSTPTSNSLKLVTNGCDYCDKYKVPMSQSKLRKHLAGATCQICKETIAPLCRIKMHYVQCAYNLAPTEANKDLLTNDGTRPANCPLCGMRLQTINGLKSHLRMTESVCKECGETFPAQCVFRLHQAKTRHGRKENVCPICSKGFQYSRDLKKHLLIHTGERPYRCLICGNSYRNPGHLSYHLKVQHGGARPYKCKYCGRGFGALSGCHKHEKRHEKKTQNKCDHCGMMFVAAHSLTKHLANKVCLVVDKDVPQMLPNLLEEDHAFTMDIKHEINNHQNLLENHKDEDSDNLDISDEPEQDSDPDSDPGSDPEYRLQPSSSVPSTETKKHKKKSNSKTPLPEKNHEPLKHRNSFQERPHQNSLEETRIIKEEPLSD